MFRGMIGLVLAAGLSGCTLKMGQLPYKPMTDGRIGYSEQMAGEINAGSKSLPVYEVEYKYLPRWSKPVEGKAVMVNLLYRAADFTRERGQKYFVLNSPPSGVIAPDTPWQPQTLPGTQGEYEVMSYALTVTPCASADEAHAVAEQLPHKVVYEAARVMKELQPYVAAPQK